MKPALSSTTLRSSPPGEVVSAAARMGYEAVELWAEHIWDTGADPAALGTVVDTLLAENLSIDRGTTDIDWYLITLTATDVTIEIDPIVYAV